MATETKSSTVKLKSRAPDGSSKGKIDSSAVRKKVESSSKLPADSKMKSVSTVTKSEVKSKSTSSSSKTVTQTTTKAREKKVYSLPGQKHDPPEQKEPLRVFYESLSKQIPTSEMAEFCLKLSSFYAVLCFKNSKLSCLDSDWRRRIGES
uniref:Uncharacterized protein n=1 Tax=Glycine max TaxID=3847 RepID=K7M6T8_SOYBN